MGTDYKTERNFRLIRKFGVLDENRLSERSVLRLANLRRFLLANLASCVLVGSVLTAAVLVEEHFSGQYWIRMVVTLVVMLLYWVFYRSIFNKAFFEREDLLGRFLWDVYINWGILGALVVVIATARLIPPSGGSDYMTLVRFVGLYAGAMHLLGVVAAMIREKSCRNTGTTASSFSIAPDAITIRLVAIPAGVPSQLLERRPDVAAAERRVQEANAQIGVARAAYFPVLSLGGSGASQSTSVANLLSSPSLIWSVGASLAQTLFDGGERKAVTERSRAIYQGTVANYRETALSAFQEVEDNLATLRILSQELAAQDAAVVSSEHFLSLAQVRYTSGLDSYLDVAAAQTTLLANQRAATNLKMEQLAASVQLVKALGGGWDASRTLVNSKFGTTSVR